MEFLNISSEKISFYKKLTFRKWWLPTWRHRCADSLVPRTVSLSYYSTRVVCLPLCCTVLASFGMLMTDRSQSLK